MFRPLSRTADRAKPRGRRGAILVVVLALLTMFALIALSFLFLAIAEAEIARLHKEAAAGRGGGPPAAPNPDAYVNQCLAGLIFDVAYTDVLNSLRGHSLARGMYGWHGGAPLTNLTPYSGIGPFHEPSAAGIDSARWVNFAAIMPGPAAGAFSLRDPEWSGGRDQTQVNLAPWAITTPAAKFFIPKNGPWTYPDLNNFALAQLSPATGEVLTPSFVRPWLFTMVPPNVAGGNMDWLTPKGRMLTVRPRPVDQLTPTEIAAAGPGLNAYIDAKIQNGELIPYPGQNADGTYTGDHQLLTGGVGVQKNDSILMDIGLPPLEWPPNSGKLIKPLVAMLMYDLDGSLDLNSIGNVRGPGGNHTSYAGYGPWEINLARALDPTLSNAALIAEANSVVRTKYGPTFLPFARGGRNSLPYDLSGGRLAQYSVVNWDGTGSPPGGTTPIQLPQFGGPSQNPFFVRPLFGGAGFFDDNIFDNPATPPPAADPGDKYGSHAGLFNPNDWGSPAAGTPPPMPGTPFVYPLSDLKRLRYKYADELTVYQETVLGKMGTTTPAAPLLSLVGSFPSGTQPQANAYRLDPAHAKRMLFSMLNADIDQPGLPPNFFSNVTGFLQLNPGQPHASNPTFTGSFANAPANSADFNSANDWRNPRAALGPIDLNRPLSDYRTDLNTPLGQPSTTQPSDTSNMGNNNPAATDRQNLARDIFARLIIATGAKATVAARAMTVGTVNLQPGDVYVDPSVTAPGTPEYNALRYLAQIAVNMVDTLDGDDINTTFVWAPTDGGMPAGNFPLAPVTAGNLPAFLTANMTAPDIQNRVVYGFERPRLVINEAYGELTNGDEAFTSGVAPTQNARVRFWVELMNPTVPPYPNGTTGPLGSGAVTLYNGSAMTPYNPYQLQVADGAAGATDLANTANPAGDITPANINLTFDFSTAAPAQQTVAPVNGAYQYNPATGTPGFAVVGPPNFTNVHADGGGTNPVEFRPDTTSPPFNQMIVGTAPAAMSTTAMEYTFGAVPSAATLQTDAATNPLVNLRRNLVVLRRLVNPYLPPSPTNPYITVDKMDWVPAFDAIARSSTDLTTNRNPKGASNITGPGFEAATPMAGRRYAVGRVQPYAGYADATPYTAGNNAFPAIAGFPTSMVIQQDPANPPPQGPLHTFFRQNGRNDGTTMGQPAPNAGTYVPGAMPGTPPTLNDTIMAPFDWLVHFDRSIINPLELMQVQAVKPHEVTHYFLQPPPPSAAWQSVRRGLGDVPWFGVQPTTGFPVCDANTGFPIFDMSAANSTNKLTNNGLYRAIALLRTKSWTYGEAAGGRTRGKVNLNTMQDIRILRALLDAQPGNTFTDDPVVTNLWTNLIIGNAANGGGGRTFSSVAKTQADGTTSWVVPVAGKTIDDADPSDPNFATEFPNLDRPFKAFGVPEYVTGSTTAAIHGSGIQDTILRMGTNGYPLIANPGQGHPYLRDEMARKLFNNTKTVSNVFAVHLRIVYHEVRTDPTTGGPMFVVEVPGYTRYLLGREAFREAPGDMRQDFFAVIDRTKLMVTPGGGPLVAQPFYTAVENIVNLSPPVGGSTHKIYLSNATLSATGLTVYSDGAPTALSGSFKLVLGVGSNQEVITVDNVDLTDGGLLVGATTPLQKPHARGELVANGVPGNPGPISTALTPNLNNPGPFDVLTNPVSPYRAVVPYITQIE